MKNAGHHSAFLTHGPLSDPGRHGPEIGRIQGSSATLGETVQGLLMHDGALPLYGLEASQFACFSRQTLSVEMRLDQFCDPSGALDLAVRAPESRMIGTCRDYALLMTGLLRQHGVAARVRCGFAAYLSVGTFDDHWICQAWSPEDRRWQIIDAQLDERHRRAYGIGFDHLDVPADQFLTAERAWEVVRAGTHDAALFNAGAGASGEWLMCVNLARDCLALRKQETSPWDRWRSAPVAARRPDTARAAWADRVAAEIAHAAQTCSGVGDARLPGPAA